MKSKWYTRLLAFILILLGGFGIIIWFLLGCVAMPIEYVLFNRDVPYFTEAWEKIRERIIKSNNVVMKDICSLTGWSEDD